MTVYKDAVAEESTSVDNPCVDTSITHHTTGFTNDEVVPLRSLSIGQRARIIHVRAFGELGRRIRDMGLIPGVDLTVVGRAPLKDPVALRLLGFTLSLRNSEADYITVSVLP